jgi:tetratricopeptide (TPR) repeat protein
MSRGNGYLEKQEATNAIAVYERAMRIAPEDLNLHLNLANAYLLAESNSAAIDSCQLALKLDHNSAAAYYLMGLAYMHLEQPEPAVQAFEQSQKIDPAVTALNFQLAMAQARLGHNDEAIQNLESVVQFDPDHPSAHYQLSRLLQQAGQTDEAASELKKHQELLAKNPNLTGGGAAAQERCKYTQPQVAFVLEQPSERGALVRFVEATATAFGQRASDFHGPMTVLDFNHDGRNSLFVVESNGFRLLVNNQGRFEPLGNLLTLKSNATYLKCLSGDLDNDGFEDVVMLGEQDSRAFKFETNGQFRDFTRASGLQNLKARDGILADLDFTGKLDLLAVLPEGNGLRVYRNLGNFYFADKETNSGLPLTWPGVTDVTSEDWNNEGLPGIFSARAGKPPSYFAKQRAGAFVETNLASDWPSGSVVATGDLNNDLQPDLIVAGESEIIVVFDGTKERARLSLKGLHVKGLLLFDYDNDGWLDVFAYGDNGVRAWRNRGRMGFLDVTKELGLDSVSSVSGIVAADFDDDGDTDLIVSSAGGLRYFRNDGGNANRQLKLRLAGHRSNSSALGVRAELAAGNWRTSRTLHELPFEIGVGQHDKLDSVKIHWFDLASTLVDVPVNTNILTLDELTLPSGSCPNLYAWDGHRFKFVTDILGAAPLGLPLTESRFIEADPEEFLSLGDNQRFPTRDGKYEVRVTEELREVLYLDSASLVAVDHPEGTLVFPTSKMHASKPFPPHELWTLCPSAALRKATRSDGLDVTEALSRVDEKMVSPVHLRQAQLRGLAEPYSVTMDFGPLAVERPLVLVLTGWLRFGGGMANVAASLDSSLPFPFPTLEAQLPDGSWKTVSADVGAPAGKTKTILVDLEGKLPSGSQWLRLTTAFEIHWDCAALCERIAGEQNREATIKPDNADLHWRGFSRYANLPDSLPLTPEYDNVFSTPPWDRTPSGWCTRYGDVGELVGERDDKLALLNGGDELALSFAASRLPSIPPGFRRDFFLHVVGWDKDADFHVGHGWSVEPLPFRGMDDQAYGHEPRPSTSDDAWIKKYNTRWVGPNILSGKAEVSSASAH